MFLKTIIVKYSIVNSNIYNFNETGFLMDFIILGMIITNSNKVGKIKAIQFSNREWMGYYNSSNKFPRLNNIAITWFTVEWRTRSSGAVRVIV